ncbi:MAG TPA: hypothetical protein VFE62_07795 [Gemmataceae bacterium]|nr:hypothetical protein [Gemmataceae bacterium]
MPRRILFLTPKDFADWFGLMEEQEKILYCSHYGLGDKPEVMDTYQQIPSLGRTLFSPTGNPMSERYFAHPSPHRFTVRKYTTKSGTNRNQLDDEGCKGCVTFIPMGLGAGNYIIPGEFSDLRGDEESKNLFSRFVRALRKVCYIQGTVAVGPEAAELHRVQGYRFCESLKANPSCDFRLEESTRAPKPAVPRKSKPAKSVKASKRAKSKD